MTPELVKSATAHLRQCAVTSRDPASHVLVSPWRPPLCLGGDGFSEGCHSIFTMDHEWGLRDARISRIENITSLSDRSSALTWNRSVTKRDRSGCRMTDHFNHTGQSAHGYGYQAEAEATKKNKNAWVSCYAMLCYVVCHVVSLGHCIVFTHGGFARCFRHVHRHVFNV